MSQHHFTGQYKGSPVEILMGFDRILSGYFLVIEARRAKRSVQERDGDEDEDFEDDDYLYSNLSDPTLIPWMGLPPTLDRFEAVLAEMGIKIPQSMLDGVRADGENRVGNKVVMYNEDGEAKVKCRVT